MIKDWNSGESRKAFVRLGAVTYHPPSKPGGKGRHTATLQDSSATVEAVAWDGELEALEPGFFAVEVTTSEYRNQLQAKIVRIRPAKSSDREHGFNPDDLILSSPFSEEELLERLGRVRKKLGPEAGAAWDKALELYGERFVVWPAATKIHHAYRRGLLEHTTRVCELAWRLGRMYELDTDALCLGALMHDIGKIEELGPVPGDPKRVGGELFGHVQISWSMWQGALIKADFVLAESGGDPGARAEKLLRGSPFDAHVSHLILSHHGKKEWGSPVEPATPEAHVLHLADMIDSRLAIYDSHVGEDDVHWSPAGMCVPRELIG